MSVSVTTKREQDIVHIRVATRHASEDGQQLDRRTGKIVPADYLRHVTVKADDRVLIEAGLGGDLSANPEFAFKAKAIKAGTRIAVEWVDTEGKRGLAETVAG